MTQQGSTKRVSKHTMAFMAAGLFYLAGVFEIVAALQSRRGTYTGVGAMFVSVGSLWVVLGAKYKKETKQSS